MSAKIPQKTDISLLLSDVLRKLTEKQNLCKKEEYPVADSKEKTTEATPEVKAETSNPDQAGSHPSHQGRPRRAPIKIDDSAAQAAYANFCRVSGTPEELILDFGLNPQPFGVPTEPIPINHRLIINYFTAKRMLQALHMTIQRQEATFGVLETDVQKRVVPSAMRAPIQPEPVPEASPSSEG